MSGFLMYLMRDNEDFKEAVRNVEKRSHRTLNKLRQDSCLLWKLPICHNCPFWPLLNYLRAEQRESLPWILKQCIKTVVSFENYSYGCFRPFWTFLTAPWKSSWSSWSYWPLIGQPTLKMHLQTRYKPTKCMGLIWAWWWWQWNWPKNTQQITWMSQIILESTINSQNSQT